MKKLMMGLTAGLAFCAAFASAAEAPLKDGQAIERADRLKAEYKVDDARIDGLRERKFVDSEIEKVLAIADKMPGGITDENVDAVAALRQGPPVMGWGQVAKKQGVTLGSVLGKGSEKAVKKSEKAEKTEKAARPEKAERPEKAARPEKVERPEKPEHGKR